MEIFVIESNRITDRDKSYIGRMLRSIDITNVSDDNEHITIVTPHIDKAQEIATRLIVLAVDFSYVHSTKA